MRKLIYFFVLFLCAVNTQAQQEIFTGTKNKKAYKLFGEAMQAYTMLETRKSAQLLHNCIQMDSNFVDAYMLLADIRERNELFDEASKIYIKVIEINPDFQIPYYKLAKAQLSNGEYANALHNLNQYKEKNGNQIDANKVERALITAKFGTNAVQNPVQYNPINMGAGINTPLDEYFPGVTADAKTLIYTRLKSNRTEDFYISTRDENNNWKPSRNMGPPINSELNEGTISLSSDGQYVFFTGCNWPVGEGSCDIYFSALDGLDWKEPRNLGFPVNTRAWESQPTISFDGKTLYFSSARPGGIGGMDIWMSTYNKGRWSAPQNLGTEINTPGNEESPFIAKDDATLYFTSDYHPGMGGVDIFYTRKQPDGRWGTPVNIGYPINTNKDERCLAIGANGIDAYIAAERNDGFGGLDLYEFQLHEAARPLKTGYVKGIVYDAKSLKKLRARIELIDLATGKTIIESVSNKVTGEFLFCLQGNKEYALNVSADGYLFYSQNFSLKNQSAVEPLNLDVPLQPIIVGEKVVLNNVFFEVDKFDLKNESKIELDKLVAFMKTNATISIELSGHTDNTGIKQKNIELSQNRAKAVYTYLINNGIAASRLSYKGYGDTQPVADNKTESGRKLNRRTEFKVIKL
ncbi:MAG: OmpA family protein [Bacteroidia bacterium]|nr:OmpA family protein [Bacteroidia bacterium]